MNRNLSPHEFGPVHAWLESDEGHKWMDSNFRGEHHGSIFEDEEPTGAFGEIKEDAAAAANESWAASHVYNPRLTRVYMPAGDYGSHGRPIPVDPKIAKLHSPA